MAALADSDDVVRWLSSEQLCAAAGMADRSYRRARCELLESAEVELLDGAGGRGNTNVWQVRASADAPARMARPSRRRVIPPAGTKPLLATVASPADELPAVETPAQTPAETPAPLELLIEFDCSPRGEHHDLTARRRRTATYAALMRELIALAEELRRGFGVVPSRRSIADISAQTL